MVHAENHVLQLFAALSHHAAQALPAFFELVTSTAVIGVRLRWPCCRVTAYGFMTILQSAVSVLKKSGSGTDMVKLPPNRAMTPADAVAGRRAPHGGRRR